MLDLSMKLMKEQLQNSKTRLTL